jgi:hypothetical protein
LLEGGQTANYLLFVMQGSDFRAVDVGDWYNFKPSIRHKTLSLEEAEARMTSRTRAAEGAPHRLRSPCSPRSLLPGALVNRGEA